MEPRRGEQLRKPDQNPVLHQQLSQKDSQNSLARQNQQPGTVAADKTEAF